MSHEYILQPNTPITETQLESVRDWLRGVSTEVVYTEDNCLWFLFRNQVECERRKQWWLKNPQKNDYLTAYIFLSTDHIVLSLTGDEPDRVAVALAEWWLTQFAGRLLDCGIETNPQDLL